MIDCEFSEHEGCVFAQNEKQANELGKCILFPGGRR